MKYYFKKKKDAQAFQKLCLNCQTSRYFTEGVYGVIIKKQKDIFGNFKSPSIPSLSSAESCFDAYQKSIDSLRQILFWGNYIEKNEVRKIIEKISELQAEEY